MSDMGLKLSGSSCYFPTLGAGTEEQTKGTRNEGGPSQS